MSETWVTLLIAGALLLAGFLASLTFERYRIPDFIMLILLGMVLGHLPISPFGPSLVDSLQPVLPAFTTLTLAIILFEGGLTFRLGAGKLKLVVLLSHIVAAMAITMVALWALGTRLLGFDSFTALVFGAAFAGPSATIALSFASRLKVSSSTKGAIILEGVLTNVIAAIVVLFLLRFDGSLTLNSILPYCAESLIAALAAFACGVGWHAASERLSSHRFVPMATIAWAVVVYSVFEGFLDKNGALAAFIFGVAVAYRFPRERVDGSVKHRDDVLKGFQAEISFALRTFFFVYLGLLMTLDGLTPRLFASAALLTLAIVAARIPSSLVLGRVFMMTWRETRLVMATVARGMTDVILVLVAIQSGVLPPADTDMLISVLTLLVLMSAVATATLLYLAERRMDRWDETG